MAREEAGNRPHQGCVGVQVVNDWHFGRGLDKLEPFRAIALTPSPPHLATTRKRTFDTRGFASGDQHGGAALVCGVKGSGRLQSAVSTDTDQLP